MVATRKIDRVLVTGGGGYVGALLVPALLGRGYEVRVLDLFIYGERVLEPVLRHPRLSVMKGDLRDARTVDAAVVGVDAVVHLACISNDPSFDLDPQLGRSINLDAFEPLVRAAVQSGVSRFVFASSASVYGVKSEPEVTEDAIPEPLTDYSRYKIECERILSRYSSGDFCTVVVRPATLCGCSPRQRLDVVVNILTNQAYHTGHIEVFGGLQKRPNLHIDDMVALYLLLLDLPDGVISGRIFNTGAENRTVLDLAEIVRDEIGPDRVSLRLVPTDDRRSYHISSARLAEVLGFVPRKTVRDAVRELVRAFSDGRVPRAMEDPVYYNIKMMKLTAMK